MQISIPVLRCDACSHEWAPRKREPPKKCPRCQSPYSSGQIKQMTQAYAAIDPLAHATQRERETLVGLLTVLRSGEPKDRALLKLMAQAAPKEAERS